MLAKSAVAEEREALKEKIKAVAVLINLKEQIKAAEGLQMPLQEAEEDHLMQDPADARERRAVAAAAALKVQLKEEDQKNRLF